MNGTRQGSDWPAALVAIAFIALIGAIFIAVYYREGIDAALKAWAGIGTLVGIVTGTIPGYFFAKAAQRDASALRQAADKETIERARQYGLRS